MLYLIYIPIKVADRYRILLVLNNVGFIIHFVSRVDIDCVDLLIIYRKNKHYYYDNVRNVRINKNQFTHKTFK